LRSLVGNGETTISMAASLKFLPGSTIQWRGRRYIIDDYAGLDAIIGREPGKRGVERIPVNEAKPHLNSRRQTSIWGSLGTFAL
jgi:hypothetical protein